MENALKPKILKFPYKVITITVKLMEHNFHKSASIIL